MFLNQINFGPGGIFLIPAIILVLFLLVKSFSKKGHNNLNKSVDIDISESEFDKTLFGTIFNFKKNIGNIFDMLIKISEATPLADYEGIRANLYIPKFQTPDMPKAMVAWQINKSIDGYIYLQKPDGKMFLTKDEELESVEFNKNVLTYSSSHKLPFYVLPPNLMTWYLDLQVTPVIYLKDNKGYLVFTDTLSKEEYLSIASKFLKLLNKSGALN